MENSYYIYFHINPLKNEIFYVGKGHGDRAYSKFSRSDFWKKTVNKYGFIVDITEKGLTNEEAKKREKFWIKRLGRKDLGLGKLANHTDGGDGCVNMSIETRNKISKANKGKLRTDIHNLNNSNSKLKKQIIKLDLNSNIIEEYNSISECCKLNNYSKGNIIKVCKHKIRKDGSKCLTAYGFKWEYKN